MRLPGFVMAPGIVLACTACVSVETIRADAEAVFRQHNRVASEIMLLLPELDPDAGETRSLMEADRVMLEACEPLNELAIAHREGRRPTLRERLGLPPAIDACRDATTTAEDLLANLSSAGSAAARPWPLAAQITSLRRAPVARRQAK